MNVAGNESSMFGVKNKENGVIFLENGTFYKVNTLNELLMLHTFQHELRNVYHALMTTF